MKTFDKYHDKDKCWCCGSNDLSGEHKIKKTDLELLYGKVYKKHNDLVNIKFRNEETIHNIQSSSSDINKFEKNICKKCNGAKNQNFDNAYKIFIEYCYKNKKKLLFDKRIVLSLIFGDNWKEGILNVYRYISKHIGCRMAESGFKPPHNLIDFMNGNDHCDDLKVVFQIKPYLFGSIDSPIESIFLGPINPINCNFTKGEGIVTSFSGWYTIANFSWNYICEEDINESNNIQEQINLDIIEYLDEDILNIPIREDSMALDWALGVEKIEYYPFVGDDRDVQYYKYIKNYKV